jgi:adenosylcobinamide-phosphate synthase
MSFFAVLIALLLEQVRPLSHDNPVHAAMRSWMRWVRRNLDAGQHSHAVLVWTMAVGLPVLVVAAVHMALWSFSGILTWMWTVVLLYFTLGFRQFSHHFTEIREALELGQEATAREALARWQRIPVAELPQADFMRHLLAHAVMAAHRHVLGVLVCFAVFWALGLGPAGAVLFRLADYLAQSCTSGRTPPGDGVCRAAHQAWSWINHLPARATALAFAVVGNFEEAVASWRQDATSFTDVNDGVVLAATAGALNVRLTSRQPVPRPEGDGGWASTDANPSGREPQLAHLASLVGLVWRSVVLWMLLLALLTLARLLG